MSHVSQLAAAGLLLVAAAASVARAEVFAGTVIDYHSGSLTGNPTYTNSAAALGKPNATAGGVDVTPFNATYADTEMVGIGNGGDLVLRFTQTVPANGYTIGVHAGVGLSDANYGTFTTGPTASTYTNPRVAAVSVSYDGSNWKSLGAQTFNIPTNYYDQGVADPENQTTPGTHLADFGKPFTGSLSSFNKEDWPGVLATLNGSAGGTWLDTSGTGLPGINFIRFDVNGAGAPTFIDAVAAVPEPGTASAVVLGATGLLLRRRRDTRA